MSLVQRICLHCAFRVEGRYEDGAVMDGLCTEHLQLRRNLPHPRDKMASPYTDDIVSWQAATSAGSIPDIKKLLRHSEEGWTLERPVSLPTWPHPLPGTTLPGKAGWRGPEPNS